ncbi:MAG: dihydrofolate reductase [Actinobacteria bacterium]|nr:dihydrofolate reductase family protein [Actinomycetota bacterium]TXH31049.1 MAG: dihydrofolate reductase [Actinomycetota bacterium]
MTGRVLFSMGASVDGYIADRDGHFAWTVPSEDLFRFHIARVGELGAMICGRRLYETMLVWETDPAMREDPLDAEFADLWRDLPKIVFSGSLTAVQGNARLATNSLADEVAGALASTGKDVEIGGADLAGQAIERGLVDEFRIFRYPVLVGGGKSLLPAVTSTIRLELLETRTFNDEVVYERYLRIADS